MELKKTHIGKTKDITIRTVSTFAISPITVVSCDGKSAKVLIPIKKPNNPITAERIADKDTTITFPKTMSSLFAGEDNIVSRVPLSFSPDPRSRAG